MQRGAIRPTHRQRPSSTTGAGTRPRPCVSVRACCCGWTPGAGEYASRPRHPRPTSLAPGGVTKPLTVVTEATYAVTASFETIAEAAPPVAQAVATRVSRTTMPPAHCARNEIQAIFAGGLLAEGSQPVYHQRMHAANCASITPRLDNGLLPAGGTNAENRRSNLYSIQTTHQAGGCLSIARVQAKTGVRGIGTLNAAAVCAEGYRSPAAGDCAGRGTETAAGFRAEFHLGESTGR